MCLSSITLSQPPVSSVPVTHLSVEEGLSQSTVTAMLQDEQGLLWFATADGLNRYDGNAFTVFKHDRDRPGSLPSDDLDGLALTGRETIWIGTSAGLCRYDKATNTFSPFPLATPIRTQITQLLADREGFLWVGTVGGLTLLRLDSATSLPDSWSRNLSALSAGTRIHALYEDRTGTVWIGTEQRLLAFHRSTGTASVIPLPDMPASIKSIFEDSAGILWFGTTDSRLLRYDRRGQLAGKDPWSVFPVQSENLKTPFGNFVSAIREDRVGNLWVGTRLAGLFRFDRVRHRWERFDPPIAGQRFQGVRSLSVDRSGLLWVGYDGAGLLKINPNPEKFHLFLLPKQESSGSGENFLKSVLADRRGRMWIGTYDHGLTMVDRKTNAQIHFAHDANNPSSLSDNSLLALCEDAQGAIWIGTTTGIDRFDESTRSFEHFPSLASPSDPVTEGAVWCLACDSAGTVWAGTGRGLLKYANGQFVSVLSTDSIKDNWVTCLAAAPDRSLWLGTSHTGVLRVDREGALLEHFSSSIPSTLSHNFVKCLSLQPNGELWVGTTEGISRFDPRAGSWRSYYVKDGLPDETIYGILATDSVTRWFSTNRGIVRMIGTDHPRFRCYTPEDGLQSYEFNSNAYCKAPTGELMFGGINGLNIFFPDSVTDNPHVPPIVLTAFGKFDEPFDPGCAIELLDSIRLGYRESVFSFDFAALEYTNPQRNTYAYLMEGYDREWVLCGNRHEARYTNLDPGTYVFRVRGANSDGVWNTQGLAIAIAIVPPFWRTAWFFVATLVTLAAAFGGTVRYLSVRKMRVRLDRLEQEKMAEAQRHETRERIARDLHDEVSSTLSSMSLFVEASRLRLRAGAQGAEAVLSRLHGMAREAEEAMEQAVWSLSPNSQRLSHLVTRIHDVAIEQCQEHDLACVARVPECPDDVVLADIVRKNCFLVFREILANVIRHAQARNVELVITVSAEHFAMTVRDDGAGFDPARPPAKPRGGNGLKNMHARAAEIGASLDIASHPGQGTLASLTMRIAQMRY